MTTTSDITNALGNPTHPGRRVAMARIASGWSQRELSDRANVSISLVKKVESGHAPASTTFLAACASTLGVPTTVLSASDDVAQAPSLSDYTAPSTTPDFNPLRRALAEAHDPHLNGAPWTQDRLEAAIAHAFTLRLQCRYEALLTQLPNLLRHAYALCHNATNGHDSEQAHAALHDIHLLAQTSAHRIGEHDIAALIADRHSSIAQHTGDPLRTAVSAIRHSHLHGHLGDQSLSDQPLAEAQRIATAEKSSAAQAVSAHLHLSQAWVCSKTAAPADADNHLNAARDLITDTTPARPYLDILATPANVDIHAVSVAVGFRDGATALTRATKTTLPGDIQPSRRARHHIDLANAYVMCGRRESACESLETAWNIAPRMTKNHPQAHDALHAIISRESRATARVSRLASWMGVTSSDRHHNQ